MKTIRPHAKVAMAAKDALPTLRSAVASLATLA